MLLTIYTDCSERIMDRNQLIKVIRGQITKNLWNYMNIKNMKTKIKQHVTNMRQNDKDIADSVRCYKHF